MFPGKEAGQIEQKAAIYSLTEVFIISQPVWPYHINSSPEFGLAKAWAVCLFSSQNPKDTHIILSQTKRNLPLYLFF